MTGKGVEPLSKQKQVVAGGRESNRGFLFYSNPLSCLIGSYKNRTYIDGLTVRCTNHCANNPFSPVRNIMDFERTY